MQSSCRLFGITSSLFRNHTLSPRWCAYPESSSACSLGAYEWQNNTMTTGACEVNGIGRSADPLGDPLWPRRHRMRRRRRPVRLPSAADTELIHLFLPLPPSSHGNTVPASLRPTHLVNISLQSELQLLFLIQYNNMSKRRATTVMPGQPPATRTKYVSSAALGDDLW